MYSPEEVEFPKVAYGKAVSASEEDLARDKTGFTNPNLHRRQELHFRELADPSTPYNMYNDVPQFEFGPRSYKMFVSGYNSYRMTEMHNHDEDSTYWEIP